MARTATRRGPVILGAALALAGSGCATSRPRDPAATVQRFLDLSAADHDRAAYGLLSESFRRSCDLPCYTRLAARQREDARRAAADLRKGSRLTAERIVEVTLADGTALRLGEGPEVDGAPRPPPDEHARAVAAAEGPYRFTQNPLEFYPQSTPEEAVRSFVRAVHGRRYEALLRFVPKALAEQLTAGQLRQRFEGPARPGLLAQLAALQQHAGEPFQIEGNTARLPTGEGQEVRLVLEQGRWRVAQLE
jgi:hypothetical protein